MCIRKKLEINKKNFLIGKPSLVSCWSYVFFVLILIPGLWPQSSEAASVQFVRDINRESRSFSSGDTFANDRYSYHLRSYKTDRSELWVTDGRHSRQHQFDESIGIISSIIGLTQNFVYVTALNRNGVFVYQIPAGRTEEQANRLVRLDTRRYLSYGISSLTTANGEFFLRLERPENRFDLMRVDEGSGQLEKISGLSSGRVQVVGERLFILTSSPDKSRIRLLVLGVGSDRPRFVAQMPLANQYYDPQLSRFNQEINDDDLLYFQIADRLRADGSPVCTLWRSDGTRSGTSAVVRTGTLPGARSPACPGILGQVGNAVYFERENTTQERLEVWSSEGTAATLKPFEHTDDIDEIHLTASTVWFTTHRNNRKNWMLWRKDDPASSAVPYFTTERRSINQISSAAGGITFLTDYRNLYYASRSLRSPAKIGRFLNVGESLTTLGDLIVFDATAVSGRSGATWYSYDTGTGKRKVLKQFNSLSNGSETGDHILTRNDEAWFCSKIRNAAGASSLVEVWRSDGSRKGTIPVEEKPGSLTNCGGIAVDENYLYFVKQDSQHGAELWRSGHLGDNKELLADLLPGTMSSSPREISVVNNQLLVTARTQYQGKARYHTVVLNYDGSWSLLKPEMESPFIVASSSQLALITTTSGSRKSLWATDGTPTGTRKIANDLRRLIKIDESEGTFYVHLRSRNATGVFAVSPDAIRLKPVSERVADLPGTAQFLRYHRGSLFFRDRSQPSFDTYNFDRVLRFDITSRVVETVFQRPGQHVTDAGEMAGQLFFNVSDVDPRDPQPLGWRVYRYTIEEGVTQEFRIRLTYQDRAALPYQPPATKMYGDGNRLWFFAPAKRTGVELWQISP